MTKAKSRPGTYEAYEAEQHQLRVETERRQRLEERERDLVKWVHELGAALRRLREASDLSAEGLGRKLDDPTGDLDHLSDGFSDRVQVGHIKSFVDACGGFLDIIVYDKDGQIVSARELAPIGRSATRRTHHAVTATGVDEDALAQRVTANVLHRLVLALETAVPMKEADRISSYTLHESPPPYRADDEDPA
jgi:hypothetical protein